MPQRLRAELNLFERLLFSKRSYAKNIEVKAYILTREQAYAALCNPVEEPIQLDKEKLYSQNAFLMLLVRNTGKEHAWGTLACKVAQISFAHKGPCLGYK